MYKLITLGFVMTVLCFDSIFAAIPFGQDIDLQSVYSRVSKMEDMGKYDDAQKIYDSVITESVKTQDKVAEAFFTRLKGRTYLHADLYDSAMLYANKARNLSLTIHNDSIFGLALLNIGSINMRIGEMDSAHYYYSFALKVFTETNDTLNMADALHGLLNYYKKTDELDLALEVGLKSNYLFKKLNNTKNYIQSLNDVANIYEKLGAYDTALSCYKEVYSRSLENDFPNTAATAMNNMAVVYYKQGNYEKSKNYLLKAIEYNESINDKSELAMLYGNISFIYNIEGNHRKQLESLEKSLELATEINNVTKMLNTMEKLGTYYYEDGNLKKAEYYFVESLKIAQKTKNKTVAKNTSLLLASLYKTEGKMDDAFSYLNISIAYQDSLINSEKAKIIENALTKNQTLVLNEMIKEINASHKGELERLLNKSLNLQIIFIFIVVTLGGILITFIMRAKKNRIIAQQKIQQLEDEQKLMRAHSVLIGQENERKRIAHDLHDGIGVLLSTASIQFSKIKVDPDDPETGDLFKRATKLLNEAGGEVRKISRNMMPGVLSKLGLRDAIEDLFESVNDIEGVNTNLKINCSKERLPENTEIMIYRVVQELVNNTVKHAKASEITFEIDREKEIMHIIYTDNGIGFDKKKVKKGIGLNGIRSRIDFLKGKLSLQTGMGKGTHYKIEIPLSA